MSENLFPVAAGSNAVSIVDEAKALSNVHLGSGDSVSHLKFTKAGSWLFGRDNDEIEGDELLAVNPLSFVAGWQGWEDGRPVNGPVKPMREAADLPAESDLQAIKPGDMNGWNPLLGVTFRLIEGELDLQYHATSYSGKQFIAKLKDEVMAGITAHADAPICLINVSSDSYKHAKYGKISTPQFKVVGWATEQGEEVPKLTAG